MQLFKSENGELLPIERDAFKLEKEIQSLVEANMDTIFGLEFVSSEFSIAEFRLDSLAYDEQNNSFVIVEYKKGSSYSVVDQGYSYLSTMLNNKADFILEYNEKTDKTLRRDDIDWSASRVIFVSPSFNSYQKNSVNFRDVPFELWEIRRFEGGVVALEQHTSSSKESIESVSTGSSGSVIKTVSGEVKVSSEDQLITSMNSELQSVWSVFREQLLSLSGTSTHTTRNYLAIKFDGNALIYVRFRKNEISCELPRGNTYPDGSRRGRFFEIDDPKNVTKVRTWNWKSGVVGSVYNFSLSEIEEIDYRMFLVKQRHELVS